MNTVEIVRSAYENFARGNVPAILEILHPDVDWEYGAVANGVPWLAPRRGREGVGAFFQTALETLEFKSFEVLELLGNDRVAVALVRHEAVVKRTGKTLREECEAHIWHFDPSGRVVRMRHAADTYGHVLANTP